MVIEPDFRLLSSLLHSFSTDPPQGWRAAVGWDPGQGRAGLGCCGCWWKLYGLLGELGLHRRSSSLHKNLRLNFKMQF